MEEERIGAMYWNLWVRRVVHAWGSLFPRGFRRSPLLPATIIVALILGPALAWKLHRKGQFGRAKRKINREIESGSAAYNDPNRPGGQNPMVLSRVAAAGSTQPEFVSVTLLPGLGMSVLQIMANVPGAGAVTLLQAPSVTVVGQGLTDPPSGFNDDRGAFELPWGGELTGATSPVGTTISVEWNGQTIEQSTESSAQTGVAEGGMLKSSSSQQADVSTAADGMKAMALFTGVNEDDRWPSKSDVSVSAQLSAQAIEFTVLAKNTGDQAEPMGIGWHPRFAIAGRRDHVQLRLPGGEVMALSDEATGIPSGKVLPVGASLQRYQGAGAELGASSFDQTLVNLQGWPGTAAEIRFPEAGYGLRLVAVSSTIHALRVVSPSGSSYISLGPQTNLDDPFGKEWTAPGGGEMVTLQPGQTLEWKVRLQIFPVAKQ